MVKEQTKQEEIREGRLQILEKWGIDERVEILNDLEQYDNSQGVVLKVEGELPMPSCSGTEEWVKAYSAGGERILSDLAEAGYEPVVSLVEPAVESLIKRSEIT